MSTKYNGYSYFSIIRIVRLSLRSTQLSFEKQITPNTSLAITQQPHDEDDQFLPHRKVCPKLKLITHVFYVVFTFLIGDNFSIIRFERSLGSYQCKNYVRSSSCSQGPATGPYPEPAESSLFLQGKRLTYSHIEKRTNYRFFGDFSIH